MSAGKVDDGDQIVASGEALSVVSKWLGLSSFQEALAADPVQNSTDVEELRPPLLGLGADPRKYHKALTAASKLERRLGQRLKGQQDGQQSSAGHSQKNGATTGQTADTAEASEQEEEEEEGRAGAIQKQKRPFQQDLMLYQKKGKKKRKKNAP
ncbi:hypothetical protein COCSUDRAFT_62053 [Coccomyxa subellipsoidea C-169]|uniref:Uncharacterized protein n=1 Tax=Coccomyxa subellipsoidea (strain C-169) TaxID=574566 RepID=I0Z1V1_COCSC|nr:hypothetical protein COCSUDRAFT_62053 [Coccomyxa subellipsoidea C-169]EIE24620.1 hypothetical protein COCSUDRAFT_62053 [Coccomyxa subellipsoidea C-169]|eukprot:XP_005649164.1 hypothetical protein COCSUDRAFT_62053 [Coccomyxa subellipsoidea C-169]